MGFTSKKIAAFVGAFLDEIAGDADDAAVCVGADLRASSPKIAAMISAVAANKNWHVIYAGNVPTPALALYALKHHLPALMVTGSHIPASYNGIKFYRRDGELLKQDEAPIRIAAERLMASDTAVTSVELPSIDHSIAEDYKKRYLQIFSGNALADMRVGVDLHSAVGRDILVDILKALGATVTPFRRSETFIAVDTEALDTDDLKRAQAEIAAHNLDAVVSTDGDGDRPLLIDASGQQINGDVLGALTAKALNIDTVVTPLSSTSAIEQSNWFKQVIRTKIGSPHVVAAMAAAKNGNRQIAGFEANGGFLTETDLRLSGGQLSRLPTRDAVLPIITVLALANAKGQVLGELAGDLPSRFMLADRIKQVDPEAGKTLLADIARSDATRQQIDTRLSTPVNIDTLDGTRLTYSDASIIHFRQSGNAPEMRCYIETEDRGRTVALLEEILAGLKTYLTTQGILR